MKIQKKIGGGVGGRRRGGGGWGGGVGLGGQGGCERRTEVFVKIRGGVGLGGDGVGLGGGGGVRVDVNQELKFFGKFKKKKNGGGGGWVHGGVRVGGSGWM